MSKRDNIIIYAAVAAFTVFLAIFTYKIMKYPEIYSTSARYQLQNKISRGDAEAVNYYNQNYINNGIKLF